VVQRVVVLDQVPQQVVVVDQVPVDQKVLVVVEHLAQEVDHQKDHLKHHHHHHHHHQVEKEQNNIIKMNNNRSIENQDLILFYDT
jgi:hypothetical protein